MTSTLSRGLGWFSAALGMTQLADPQRILGLVGLQPTRGRIVATRLVGVRELTVVPGLLSSSRPVGWLAARVAGDVMDLALLGWALRSRDADRGRLFPAIAAVGGILVIDAGTAWAARREQLAASRHGDRIVRTVTVGRSTGEVYAFWRDLENLPRIMPHLESVSAPTPTTSHWVARAPLGTTVEWDAEVVDDVPNERIAWRSVPGSQIHHAGVVQFRAAPGGIGTEVRVELDYRPPGGAIGRALAAVSGEEPGQQIADALRRFKQVLETGEPIISEATATGHRIAQHPGQPIGDDERVAIPAMAGERVGVAS